jgi:hypothetical protein
VSRPVDPARCPLCGEPNACARAAGLPGECWCAALRFPAALLARVPEPAAGRACVCRRCQQAQAEPAREPA